MWMNTEGNTPVLQGCGFIVKGPRVLEWKTFRIGHFPPWGKTFRVLEKDSVVESNKHHNVWK